jgi:radical SAM superfamily enzyme YgiQ (UPF0313 family)
MRILLVKPHPELLVVRRLQEGFLHLEPLELEIVAGALSPEEEVRILDLTTLNKDHYATFEKVIKEWKPDLVGFTAYSTNVNVVKKLAGIVKSVNPKIINVVGGIHATLLPLDYAISAIDIIVRGEGGVVLKEIIRRARNKEELFFAGAALSPKDVEFKAKASLPPPEYPDINKVALPRRDLVNRKDYFCVWTSSETKRLDNLFPPIASMRTSIGCAFSCSFCVIPHIMHGKYLQRSVQDVVDEIAGLKEDYVYFVDDEMFLNLERCKEIAGLLLERKIKKHYVSWTRSDTIVKHPELFRLWKKAGLETLYVGIESMDESRLNEYKKRTPVEVNRRAIEILKEAGITLHAALIVHPDFTVEDFDRLEKEVLSLCPAEVSFTVLSPSPGTQFW